MDSLTIKPTFSFNFSFSNPQIKPLCCSHISFFRFTNFTKLRTSSISFYSHRTPSNSEDPKPKRDTLGLPLNPLLVLVPVLQSVKGLVFSQSGKWVSVLQAHREWEVDDGSGKYLQNSGLGIALLSVTSNAKLKISPFAAQLAANLTFVSGLFAWALAQSIKVVLNFFVE